MGEWVRMMMDGRNASTIPNTIAIAQEKATNKIVTVVTRSPQTWYYENIPLEVIIY